MIGILGVILYVAGMLDSPQYTITKEHDSLYWLNEWKLPYPVFQFQTGDVDGDGQVDALVGVIKTTRYHKEMGRRLFIFKQVNRKVRPLWLGSQLGGKLIDFRFISPKKQSKGKTTGGIIRTIETAGNGRYFVTEWKWGGFGLKFERYLIQQTDEDTALRYFRL